MLAPVSTRWLTECRRGWRLTDMIAIIALWMECPEKLRITHRTRCLLQRVHCIIPTLSELQLIAGTKDGPASCWPCQGSPLQDWLVRVHLLTSETYCSTLNIKPGSKLPSVDKNIFGLRCNVKWHSGTQVVHTVGVYLWKEKFCGKMTGRNHASMVTVVAPTDGTWDNL